MLSTEAAWGAATGEPGSGGSVLPPAQRGTRARQRLPLSPVSPLFLPDGREELESSLALTALYYGLSHFPHLHAIVSTHRPENVQEWFSKRKRFPYSALRFKMCVHAQSRLTLLRPRGRYSPPGSSAPGTAKSAGVGCHSLLQASHLSLLRLLHWRRILS